MSGRYQGNMQHRSPKGWTLLAVYGEQGLQGYRLLLPLVLGSPSTFVGLNVCFADYMLQYLLSLWEYSVIIR